MQNSDGKGDKTEREQQNRTEVEVTKGNMSIRTSTKKDFVARKKRREVKVQ